MIRHLTLNIQGALRWPDKMLTNLFINNETKRPLTAGEARIYLTQELNSGKLKLPLGDCNNFDFQKGCPGHQDKK